jgi:hypothetical protein
VDLKGTLPVLSRYNKIFSVLSTGSGYWSVYYPLVLAIGQFIIHWFWLFVSLLFTGSGYWSVYYPLVLAIAQFIVQWFWLLVSLLSTCSSYYYYYIKKNCL